MLDIYKKADWDCKKCGHTGMYIISSDGYNTYCMCEKCFAKNVLTDGELWLDE